MPDDLPSEPLRVLIVGNEPLLRWAIAATLGQEHCLVTEAASAQQAFDILARLPHPDVVFVDCCRPEGGDLGTLRALRLSAPTAQFVVLAAHCPPELIAAAQGLGAFAVRTKPLPMAEFGPLVRQAYAARVKR